MTNHDTPAEDLNVSLDSTILTVAFARKSSTDSSEPRFAALRCLLAGMLLLVAQSASALTTVGPAGSGCTYTSIKAAVADLMNDERAGKNVDPYIAVVSGGVYNEAVTVDSTNVASYKLLGVPTSQAFVQIYGDLDPTCSSEDGSSTATINMAGKAARGLVIEGNSAVSVVLNHLTIANGNITGSGGGIVFIGSGSLDLTNVDVAGNVADYGGGIDALGESSGITVTLHSNTRIYNNVARQFGGGILIEGATRLVDLESPTLIWNNTADPASSDGTGGGLLISGPASADIGGTYAGLGVIDSNHAKNGGGVAVLGGGGLRLFSTVAGVPALIAENTATSSGGGLYVDHGNVCASVYAIDNNVAGVANGTLGEGSAIFVRNGGDVHLTETQLSASDGHANTLCGHGYALPPRAPCPIGVPCNQINSNGSNNGDDTILVVDESSTLVADRFESRSNHAHNLAASSGLLKLGDCLIARNATLSTLIAITGEAQMNGCTVAGNAMTLASEPLILMSGASSVLTLANSILALNTSSGSVPTTLAAAAGTLHATDVIASEVSSLTTALSSNVNPLDPAFMDPANGDYHLRPESPAVDYHLTGNPDPFQPPKADLDGRVRDVPLLIHRPLNASAFDIGAYELQSLGDLIFVDSLDGVR